MHLWEYSHDAFRSPLDTDQAPSEFNLVWSLSCVRLFAASWRAACQASLSITNSQNLLELMSIKLVMPSNHLILCRTLLLPSIFPSIRVFSNESVLHIKWPKYWSLSFNTSPSKEYSGLISFRIDWLDLLAVQGTLKIKHKILVARIEKWNIIWRVYASGQTSLHWPILFLHQLFFIVFELMSLFKVVLPWVSIAHGLSFIVASGDCSLVAVHRLLTAVASLVPERGL